MWQAFGTSLLVVSALFYYYYGISQEQIANLQKNNATLNYAVEEQQQTIETLQKDFELQTQSLSDMQEQQQKNQLEMQRYLDIFKRHNLSKLAAAKPGLIEKRVNNGTKSVFDSIESDSAIIDSIDDGLQLVPGKGTDNQSTDG